MQAQLDERQQAAQIIRQTLTQVKQFLAQEVPTKLSEADTKANFIERYIRALGYEGLEDVVREYYVKNSQEFIDYVLRLNSKPALAIEAKALQLDLTDKHAAQLIQYCSIEGIEWCALTNARSLWLFNTFLKGDQNQKLLIKLDLLGFNNDEEFAGLFDQLWLLSKTSLASPTTINSWMEQRRLDQAIRAILLSPHSATVHSLVSELASAHSVVTQADDVLQWVRGRLTPNLSVIPSAVAVPAAYTPKATPNAAGPNYWMVPAKGTNDGKPPVVQLHRWLDQGFWGVYKSTSGRTHFRPGDYICFYANQAGVVAIARIKGLADAPVQESEWPEPMPYDNSVYKVPLKEVSWLEQPRPITSQVRAQLDAFKGKDPESGKWSWLVQSTSKLSAHDFDVLTAGKAAA